MEVVELMLFTGASEILQRTRDIHLENALYSKGYSQYSSSTKNMFKECVGRKLCI
jgi:hypothetical protein